MLAIILYQCTYQNGHTPSMLSLRVGVCNRLGWASRTIDSRVTLGSLSQEYTIYSMVSSALAIQQNFANLVENIIGTLRTRGCESCCTEFSSRIASVCS
jgi:hypothetical protein